LGAAILRHAHPEVIAALHPGPRQGHQLCAPCALGDRLAELVIEAGPRREMVRSSTPHRSLHVGVRLMRAFMAARSLIKVEAVYPATPTCFLVKAAPGVCHVGLPVPPACPRTPQTAVTAVQRPGGR